MCMKKTNGLTTPAAQDIFMQLLVHHIDYGCIVWPVCLVTPDLRYQLLIANGRRIVCYCPNQAFPVNNLVLLGDSKGESGCERCNTLIAALTILEL